MDKIKNYKFKTKPYAHQIKALELSWDKPYYAYFMEMGTGKSKVLIDNIAMLYDAGKINGVLIIAPKGVYKNWYDGEIPTHLPDHVEHTSVLWQSMITKKQQSELDKVFVPGEDLHILIMNVEAFSTKKGVEFAAKFLRCHRTMMAIDESTTIKNPDAKRTKHICTLGEYAGYKRILTGSPVTKSPLDLYKQCEFLKKELLGHSSYYTFRTRYAVMKTANFGGKSVQIVNVISDEYGDDSIVQYYGAIDSEKRQENIKKFQDPNSKARFFIGNPQTGGYGITLTAASNVIYYSNGYDLEKRLQSEDRAHRIGQKKSVTYVDLIAPKTVDEKIRKALRKKINIATQVMGEELRDWI